MRKWFALAVGVVVIWSVQDILIWQRLFEVRRLWQFNDQYQFWHQAFLISLIAIGASQLRGKRVVRFIAATWTLAYGGLADILYYWLDRRPIPATLPWLDHGWNQLVWFRPSTNVTLVLSASTWLAVWLVVLLVVPVAQRLMLVASVDYGSVVISSHSRTAP